MELGNMMFGLSRGEAEVPRNSRWEGEMMRLMDAVARAEGDKEGDGYGKDFSNGVFEMMPYYWGECECGFESGLAEWEADNKHTPECFYTRYHEEEKRIDHIKYDFRRKKMIKWSKENGFEFAPEGMAVHCDCGHREEYHEFLKDNDHDFRCRIVRPNFLYKPTGFHIKWYKYIFRDSYMTPEISIDEFRKIIDHCIASLELKGPKETVELSLKDAEDIMESFAHAFNAANGWDTGWNTRIDGREKVDEDFKKLRDAVRRARKGG